MNQEIRPAAEEKPFELLGRAGEGLEITTRDDQYDFTVFLDAAKMARRSGGRLRLVDTGRLSVFELEWLAEAGADLFTSDVARPDGAELGLLAKACSRGDSVIAFFHHGALTKNAAGDTSSWDFLREIGRDGLDVHLSSRERERDLAELAETAHVCKKAESRLVYYHHGPLAAGLETLARSGGWIHVPDEAFTAAETVILLGDVLRAATAAGSGLVIHVEKGLASETVHDLIEAGAFVHFETPPAGRGSSFRALEKQARKRPLDRRAYYLYLDFLP